MLNWRDVRNPEAGGAELHLQEIASHWTKLGNEVTLLCSSFKNAPKIEKIDGVFVQRIGNKYTIYPSVVKYLLSKKGKRYDAIFESINTIPFFSPCYSRLPIVAQIYSLENKSVLSQEIKWYMTPVFLVAYAASALIPRIYNGCEVTTISQSSKQLIMKYGFNKDKIHVAYPGVSDSWFESLRNAPKIERPNSNLAYLGRLKKYKGVQDILKAIPLIRKKIPGVKLRVVGKGDYEVTLRNISRSLGIQENVEFCGFVSEQEKASILRSSSLYVCTSLDEGGWTIAAIESQTAGVPVLVTRSQIDVVSNGVNGYLLDSNDPNLISEKTTSILADKVKWREFSANAEEFSKKFNWENTASVTLDVLRQASAGK